ncbi:DUF6183 family protein [Actinoplanes sp. NPDC051494]|uniref:DUF6183 family protein n=1 Tax=Actinoplanes sp. NPDC051494 TaxID=3363907 RepID=UPI0037945F67
MSRHQDGGRCLLGNAGLAAVVRGSLGWGAYNSGEFGAYGRLFAWRSLKTLAGARLDAPASEVEALAHRCSWYSFAGTTNWFESVAWDIGLAVLSPDRRRLAVLAATDTD